MHCTAGELACALAISTLGVVTAGAAEPGGTPEQRPLPSYSLRGYYSIDSQRPVWKDSDSAPWQQVSPQASWVNRRLVKWGYIPFTHDSRNYYCLIDERPRTGSHIKDVTFICGDPGTVQSVFLQNNGRPVLPMIGGGPPLESSLRHPAAAGN